MTRPVIFASLAGAAATLAALFLGGWLWWARPWKPLWLDGTEADR
jgi:hypothetical protein